MTSSSSTLLQGSALISKAERLLTTLQSENPDDFYIASCLRQMSWVTDQLHSEAPDVERMDRLTFGYFAARFIRDVSEPAYKALSDVDQFLQETFGVTFGDADDDEA